MKNWQEKMMKASFGRLFQQWFAVILCVALLGGGTSVFLLRPQISETITAVQQVQEPQWEQEYHSEHYDKEKLEGRKQPGKPLLPFLQRKAKW